MKRTALLLSLIAGTIAGNAQVTLSGTSYTQDFSSFGAATPLTPTGWYGYTGATATSAGTIEVISTSKTYGVYADTSTSTCKANVWNDDFKNYPSANANAKDATCANQATIADRALGVRQKSNPVPPATGKMWDPGAAFVFKAANTTGLTNFNLTFKLQSLDTTSPRTTTWTVDYGVGATPTSFTPVTATGTMTTGGLTYTNNTINVNFGSALDNKSSVVWIRVVTLANSTGSGNRASSAIDDFNLSWTGTANGVEDITGNMPSAALSVLGESTSDNINFAYNVAENGKYNLSIFDMTGRNVYNEVVYAISANHHTVSGLNLPAGFYVARLSNGTTSATAKFGVN